VVFCKEKKTEPVVGRPIYLSITKSSTFIAFLDVRINKSHSVCLLGLRSRALACGCGGLHCPDHARRRPRRRRRSLPAGCHSKTFSIILLSSPLRPVTAGCLAKPRAARAIGIDGCSTAMNVLLFPRAVRASSAGRSISNTESV
jgi:hypothetical protein